MSFCPDIYEDVYNTKSVATPPPKKENPKYDHPVTLLIKTIYDDMYEVTDVFDYGYHANSEHYWYTTINEKHLQNYIRARTVLYFGLKDCAIKEITE